MLSNFSRSMTSESLCIRPENEPQLLEYMALNDPKKMLARGAGLSYSDSGLNSNGLIVDTSRMNHLLSFDNESGIVECQGGVTFQDLFLLHPEFIPPVIPGTVHATIAGGIAHDVHGKNNPHSGSLGRHVIEFDLLIGKNTFQCSRTNNTDLFYATLGGIGLTGIITRVALRLKKATRFVDVKHQQFDSTSALLEAMSTYGISHDYQVAWMDLLNAPPRALLSTANHCDPIPQKIQRPREVPKIPFSLIHSWNMKLFNTLFFNSKKPVAKMSLEEFNNPLDALMHWNRLYGSRGLVQFQAVFEQEQALETMEYLIQTINTHHATPTLCVLKLFDEAGEGLLSFCKPGFTLAVDFINNSKARAAIHAMNQFISEINGRVYLAKDVLLTSEQYQTMYNKHELFSQILQNHQCIMQSDLAQRLGIT